MVSRQAAAETFAGDIINGRKFMSRTAHDIIERLRGTHLSEGDAAEIIAAVKARTRGAEQHPADMLVRHVVAALTNGVPAGILTDEHIARIVRAATSAPTSPSVRPPYPAGAREAAHRASRAAAEAMQPVPFTNEQRDAGRTPVDTGGNEPEKPPRQVSGWPRDIP